MENLNDKKRAVTVEQKRALLEQIFNIWVKCPEVRLGQLIYNITCKKDSTEPLQEAERYHIRIFYLEDVELESLLEEFRGILNG